MKEKMSNVAIILAFTAIGVDANYYNLPYPFAINPAFGMIFSFDS